MLNDKLIFYTTPHIMKIIFALEFFFQVKIIFLRNPICFLQPKIPSEVRVCSLCQQDLTNTYKGSDLCILLCNLDIAGRRGTAKRF